MSINVRVLAAARDDAAMCFARFLATTKQGKVAAAADGAAPTTTGTALFAPFSALTTPDGDRWSRRPRICDLI